MLQTAQQMLQDMLSNLDREPENMLTRLSPAHDGKPTKEAFARVMFGDGSYMQWMAVDGEVVARDTSHLDYVPGSVDRLPKYMRRQMRDTGSILHKSADLCEDRVVVRTKDDVRVYTFYIGELVCEESSDMPNNDLVFLRQDDYREWMNTPDLEGF